MDMLHHVRGWNWVEDVMRRERHFKVLVQKMHSPGGGLEMLSSWQAHPVGIEDRNSTFEVSR